MTQIDQAQLDRTSDKWKNWLEVLYADVGATITSTWKDGVTFTRPLDRAFSLTSRTRPDGKKSASRPVLLVVEGLPEKFRATVAHELLWFIGPYGEVIIK